MSGVPNLGLSLEIRNLIQNLEQKLEDVSSEASLTVQIVDVKYPQDQDDESGVSNAAVAVKVKVLDDTHSGYGEISNWIPLSMDVTRVMAEYGSLLVNKRARMKLPYFPSVIGAYVSRIITPMYQQEELSIDAEAASTYITSIAKNKNLGVF